MAKRTDYSKISLKSKPKSIRYNVKDFEAAISLSGMSTVQGLWDYLVAKYLADMGVRKIAPVGKMDTRPVDERVFDVSKERVVVDEMSLYKNMKPKVMNPKEWHEAVNMELSEISEMPMWKPNPKSVKIETKAETDKFAAAEMKRLKEMQERADRLKGGKKK